MGSDRDRFPSSVAMHPPRLAVPAAAPPAQELRHLNQSKLAKRWNLSERTLERWRWRRQGPRYLKVGGHVLYRLEDIEQYEEQNVRTSESTMRLPSSRGGVP